MRMHLPDVVQLRHSQDGWSVALTHVGVLSGHCVLVCVCHRDGHAAGQLSVAGPGSLPVPLFVPAGVPACVRTGAAQRQRGRGGSLAPTVAVFEAAALRLGG